MKKIIFFISFAFLLLKCTVPYDGESRYIFTTTIVDKNNNPIPNIDVSVDFTETGYLNVPSNKDIVAQTFSDNNGVINLVFPYASKIENVHVRIGKYNYSYIYEIINIKKNNFTNYKLIEPTIAIYSFDDAIQLLVNVSNTSSIKYVSKLEVIGTQWNSIKDYNPIENSMEISPIYEKYFSPIKNQNITLKYEVVTVLNGQSSSTITQEQITILEDDISYEITL